MKRIVHRRIVLGCLALLAGAPLAHAGEGDTFTPYVGYGIYSDDNLLREPDGGNRVSDTWRRATFGIRIDKEISRQHLTADLSVNDTEFDRFDNLDNDGRKLSGNWAWVVGNHFNGNIGASETRNLSSFDQINVNTAAPLEPSIRTQKRTYLDGGWRFHPSWRVRGSFNRYDVSYNDNPSNNLRLDISEIGIDYLPRSQNKIGLLVRHSDGEYPGSGAFAISPNYTQDEIKADINWKLTGKTDLEFLGGWARRNYDSDSSRNFTGPDARLIANWAATGKTGLTLAVYRELGSGLGNDPDTDYFSNYSRNTGASLGANWQATAKVRVDALMLSEKRDYNISNRSDTYRKDSVGVTFLPLRQLNIRASVYQQHLDSNLGTTYRTSGFQLVTRYEF